MLISQYKKSHQEIYRKPRPGAVHLVDRCRRCSSANVQYQLVPRTKHIKH